MRWQCIFVSMQACLADSGLPRSVGTTRKLDVLAVAEISTASTLLEPEILPLQRERERERESNSLEF